MFHRILPVLALFAALGGTLTAQEFPVKPLLDINISVDFPGGPIPEYLKAIEKQNDVIPNVVVSGVAAKVNLPPIKLKNVTVRDAILIIHELGMIHDHLVRVDVKNPHVLTVTAEPVTARGEPVQSNVFNVGNLIGDKVRIEDIVTAIQTAWEMMGPDPDSKLKYHEQTKLLIAVGRSAQLRTVESVLRELAPKSPSGKELKEELDRIKKENAELRDTMKKIAEKLDMDLF